MSRKTFLVTFIFLLSFVTGYSSIDFYGMNNNVEIINEIDDAGSYKIKLYTEDEDGVVTEKEIIITITYPRTIIDEEKQEGIDAHDFRISNDRFENASAADFIKYANAHAWSLKDTEKIMVETVTIDAIDESYGVFNITFQTKKGTKTTVIALVVDNLSLENMTEYINLDEHPLLSSQKALFSMALLILVILPVIAFLILFILIKMELKETQKALYEE